MPERFIDSALEPLSSVIRPEASAVQFYIGLSICVIVWVIVVRILMGFAKSDRGFTAALLALVLPLFFGLLAYGIVDWWIVPKIEADWAERYLALSAFGLIALLIIVILSKYVFVVSTFRAVLIFSLASVALVGADIASAAALETIEKGIEQIEQARRE